MRRVLAFFKWKSSWWLDQRRRRSDEHTAVLHGLAAYAEKQAAVYSRLAAKFARMWLPVLERNGVQPGWGSRYRDAQPTDGDENPSETDSTDSNPDHSQLE